ncbi:kinase-like domain-containing protein [Rhodofomes roseus]|uniref:Kinase-like domain-containing protein n=1 Tax=Rhodofomes roseus TaxID=34475 RepID=A0ABQ8KRT6_9APHY|nr:kinase-like domain-containing protein [Rhodofomes roseus]KAH9841518.1 kinase-like domain-containing protein [Rhodofomes roseus]
MLASLSPPAARLSPPITPPPTLAPSDSVRPSPASSDDLSLLEPSFVYERTAEGTYVRVAKGSPKSSTSAPPTPEQSPKLNPQIATKAPSPLPTTRPSTLARSESLPSTSYGITPANGGRSFQRVASGPLKTPGSSTLVRTAVGPLAAGGAARKGGARRVKIEDAQEKDALMRSQPQVVDEKENVRGMPHSHAALARPIISMRPARLMNKKSGMGIERIAEEQPSEEASQELPQPPVAPGRPRRSASLSDASGSSPHGSLLPEQPAGQFGYHYAHASHRPGTSMGIADRGARRVTLEEKIRQEREIALEEGYLRRAAEEAAEEQRIAQASSRHSPSPTHVAQANYRPYGHQRKDSDTLRSVAAVPSPSSPTAVELPGRASPPRHSIPSSTVGLTAVAQNYRHRRSPTAPEAPTTSGDIAPSTNPAPSGRTWAAGDGREREEAADVGVQSRSVPTLPPPQPPAAHPRQTAPPATQPPLQPQPAPQQAEGRSNAKNLMVNRKSYARLDMIGKGGSSRVYRVMNSSNEIYALKRVSINDKEEETMDGYINEIQLLKRLDGNQRIIRLIDSEVRTPVNGKGSLTLVLEFGEIDLAKLLQERQKEALDLVWVAYYFKQMLQAVQVIHEEKIVHSDLKPANFVLVKGQLKLIDFGIANAIANDTTNIQRDHQVGTVNYMSPEAIELPEGMRRLKVGRPSDVWSLGCILYQMIYGYPPFHHLDLYQKMRAIPDRDHVIEFPEHSVPVSLRGGSPSSQKKMEEMKVKVPPGVIATIKRCLVRNPKERITIPELLEENWLTMREPEPDRAPTPPPPARPVLADDEALINPHFMQQLLRYGLNLGREGTVMSAEQLAEECKVWQS